MGRKKPFNGVNVAKIKKLLKAGNVYDLVKNNIKASDLWVAYRVDKDIIDHDIEMCISISLDEYDSDDALRLSLSLYDIYEYAGEIDISYDIEKIIIDRKCNIEFFVDNILDKSFCTKSTIHKVHLLGNIRVPTKPYIDALCLNDIIKLITNKYNQGVIDNDTMITYIVDNIDEHDLADSLYGVWESYTPVEDIILAEKRVGTRIDIMQEIVKFKNSKKKVVKHMLKYKCDPKNIDRLLSMIKEKIDVKEYSNVLLCMIECRYTFDDILDHFILNDESFEFILREMVIHQYLPTVSNSVIQKLWDNKIKFPRDIFFSSINEEITYDLLSLHNLITQCKLPAEYAQKVGAMLMSLSLDMNKISHLINIDAIDITVMFLAHGFQKAYDIVLDATIHDVKVICDMNSIIDYIIMKKEVHDLVNLYDMIVSHDIDVDMMYDDDFFLAGVISGNPSWAYDILDNNDAYVDVTSDRHIDALLDKKDKHVIADYASLLLSLNYTMEVYTGETYAYRITDLDEEEAPDIGDCALCITNLNGIGMKLCDYDHYHCFECATKHTERCVICNVGSWVYNNY